MKVERRRGDPEATSVLHSKKESTFFGFVVSHISHVSLGQIVNNLVM